MLSRLIFGLSALVLFALPLQADEREIERAEASIYWIITHNLEWDRVTFDESKQQFLSLSEVRVVGEGVAGERNSWARERFRYSIKVRRKDGRVRDARVEFEDGRVVTGYVDWDTGRPPSDSRVRIESPRRYEQLDSRTVTFRGWSAGRKGVTVTVYDRSGRERGRRYARPDSRERWSTSMRLDPGSYRAVAHSDRWSDGDEVRFSIERFDGGWGFGGSGGSWGGSGGFGGSGGSWGGSGSYSVSIDRPRNGETLSDGIARFSGRSDADQVNILVYEGSRVVHRSTQKVFGNSWSAGPRLGSGSYRLVVEAYRGRGRDEVRFNVRTGDFGGSGGSGGFGGSGGSGSYSVSIDRPRSGESFSSGSVSFSGRSSADQVNILVYEGSRVVHRSSRRVSGGRWSDSARLGGGGYRLVVEASRGRGRDEASFSVRSGGFGGSGGTNKPGVGGGSGGFGGSSGSKKPGDNSGLGRPRR